MRFLTLEVPENIAEFANIVVLNEVAGNEPPHLYLHCLPSKSLNSQYDIHVVWT